MTNELPDPDDLAERCLADGEFGLAARYWTGGLRLVCGSEVTGVKLVDGQLAVGVPEAGEGVIELAADPEVWRSMLEAVPPRFFNDIGPALAHGLSRSSDDMIWWQYTPAVQRAVELMRSPTTTLPTGTSPTATLPSAEVLEDGPRPRFDAPTGHYVHLELGGADHRLYYEQAGQGIPLLLQHTAGSHGTQWRHLFENPAITDHFQLIAYDLPFHGKSIPPVDRSWWAEEYRLTGEFLRSVPLALASALDLDRPAFMGCSVGGLLALDLAHRHPDRFRAVVSLEGALHVGGDPERLTGFWHPQVSNESKARMMEGLTSPASPVAYRKETIQTYASGWPPAFLGDLWYYMVDYDLRETAASIDTDRVDVHILSGEYDYSATLEHGRAAHEAIAGSTFAEMTGVGHFPMSENPEAFMDYLLPVLDRIKAKSA